MATKYTVRIKTGDRSGAGTDSGVNIKLIGTLGESPDFYLNKLIKGNAFERNNDETCVIEMNEELGEVYQIRIVSDTRFAGSDWFLDFVEITASTNPQRPTRFPYSEWVRDTNPKTISAANIVIGTVVDTNQEVTVKSGQVVSVPAGVEFELYDEMVFKTSFATSEIRSNSISTKTGIDVEAKKAFVKAAIQFALNTSQSKTTSAQVEFDKTETYKQSMKVRAADVPRKFRALYTKRVNTYTIRFGDLEMVVPEVFGVKSAGWEEEK